MSHSHTFKPAEWLVENIGLLPRGRALDVAMGGGWNAVYLAKQGFEVEGVDISSAAIEMALELAQKEGVSIKTVVGDLEGEYRIEENAYDVIICFNYLQRSLMPSLRAGVKSGGVVVYETFIVDQAQFGKPHNPDFLLKYNELLDFFGDFRVLRYREGVMAGPKAIASIVAQRIKDTSPP